MTTPNRPTPDPRLSWDEHFLVIAHATSNRATCPRRRVGCVLVHENHVVSTGYNGAVRGQAHCVEIGCLMEDTHCIRTVHAEANAVALAAKHGARLQGAVAYITISPCFSCLKLLINAGITRVVYGEFYRDERSINLASTTGVRLHQLHA